VTPADTAPLRAIARSDAPRVEERPAPYAGRAMPAACGSVAARRARERRAGLGKF